MSETAPETPLDLRNLTDKIGYMLRRAQLFVFEDVIRALGPLQLRPTQFSVLLLLRDNPGRSQSGIAGALGIQRPNSVALLAELQKRGLILRKTSKADRRTYCLFLTGAGETLLAEALAIVGRHDSRMADLLGEAGRGELLELLARLA